MFEMAFFEIVVMTMVTFLIHATLIVAAFVAPR
jgi:hypothetical protein